VVIFDADIIDTGISDAPYYITLLKILLFIENMMLRKLKMNFSNSTKMKTMFWLHAGMEILKEDVNFSPLKKALQQLKF
jgi:hypothetical protein